MDLEGFTCDNWRPCTASRKACRPSYGKNVNFAMALTIRESAHPCRPSISSSVHGAIFNLKRASRSLVETLLSSNPQPLERWLVTDASHLARIPNPAESSETTYLELLTKEAVSIGIPFPSRTACRLRREDPDVCRYCRPAFNPTLCWVLDHCTHRALQKTRLKSWATFAIPDDNGSFKAFEYELTEVPQRL